MVLLWTSDPIDEIAPFISEILYSDVPFTDPSVSIGLYVVFSKDLAIRVGDMQEILSVFYFQYNVKSNL